MEIENDEIKLTVCVPYYNLKNYIVQFLGSIIHQITNYKFTILVADYDSSDITVSKVVEFENNYSNIIIPIYRKKNIGWYSNYIELHNLAKKKHFCYVDGNDLILPNKLQMQADFLDNNKEYSLLAQKVNLINNFEEKNEYNN